MWLCAAVQFHKSLWTFMNIQAQKATDSLPSKSGCKSYIPYCPSQTTPSQIFFGSPVPQCYVMQWSCCIGVRPHVQTQLWTNSTKLKSPPLWNVSYCASNQSKEATHFTLVDNSECWTIYAYVSWTIQTSVIHSLGSIGLLVITSLEKQVCNRHISLLFSDPISAHQNLCHGISIGACQNLGPAAEARKLLQTCLTKNTNLADNVTVTTTRLSFKGIS